MKKIAVMIALMLSVMLPGCGKQGTEASADEAVKNELADSVIIETGTTVTSFLTRKLVDEVIGRQRPISVMFNNVEKGCPQTGISRADVVYEAPLASNTTRLIGIIEDLFDLEKIGSIRRATKQLY